MTQNEDYRAMLVVDNTPEEVFAAITNVRGGWSETIEGKTDQLGEFRYSYKDMHRRTIRITELVPGRKVAWHVVDNYFSFVEDKTEWAGTDIVFDIARKGDETELRFTHVGLVPAYECYDVCSEGAIVASKCSGVAGPLRWTRTVPSASSTQMSIRRACRSIPQ